jgi:DNA modification methylase
MVKRPRRVFNELSESTRASSSPPGSQERQIVLRPPESLRINPRNARIHSKRQIRQITNGIKAAGFIGAIVIDENDMVLAGHGRLAAAKSLNMERVPTLKVTGLSEAQKRAFVLADNKIAENAGWDREILAVELGELAQLLPPLNWDLTLTGFEPEEIDALFGDHGDPKADPADTAPTLDANPVTRLGDLWVCGGHRVLYGDARSAADLDRVMGGVRARMTFADPPYDQRAADVQGGGRIKHPEFTFASGGMRVPEYIAFLETSLRNAARVSVNGAVHYVCCDWRCIAELIAAGRTVYGAMLNLCVWAKTNAGQGSFYPSQHELIAVFRVGAGDHQNNIALARFEPNRSNLWTYRGVNSFGAGRMELPATYPTTKPVALVADAMRDCTTRGDAVLDPFLRTGTTMLAAEKIGRRGYGLECDPRYVDCVIRRWEAYTRLEAVLDGDGRTYGEVRAERFGHGKENPQSGTIPAASKDQAAPAGGAACERGDGCDDGGDWVALCNPVAVTPARGGDK